MRSVKAFTLVELLVVIAIIGILVAVLVPSVGSGIAKSKKMKCLGNTRQIAMASQMQFDDTSRFMPSRGDNTDNYGPACSNLLEYIGEDVNVFQCPGDKYPDTRENMLVKDNVYTSYEISGWLCCAGAYVRKKSQIFDYSAAAIVFDNPYDYRIEGVKRHHKGGINVGYLDGHAAWITDAEMNLGDSNTESNFHCRGHTVWDDES